MIKYLVEKFKQKIAIKLIYKEYERLKLYIVVFFVEGIWGITFVAIGYTTLSNLIILLGDILLFAGIFHFIVAFINISKLKKRIKEK